MLPKWPHSGPCGRPLLPLFVAFFVFLYTIPSLASAQLVNGQFFTAGLAISDAPAPRSQTNAGGNLNVAIDLSGNGKLPQAAFLPTSTLPSAYQSLNIYLVSGETNLNFTVSEGPLFLQQEPGSTVKHLNWPIPPCLPTGNYNLTLYELSRWNQVSYYSITPIPITIKSQSTSPCPNIAPCSPQPQASSPPPQQPWLTPGSSPATSVSPLPPPGFPPTSGSGIATLIPSGSGTVTITLAPTQTTVTLISTMTVPTTISGIATVFTTATTITSVSTVLPSGSSGTFLPVNAAMSALHLPWSSVTTFWILLVVIYAI